MNDAPIALRAGPLTLEFEPTTGMLRRIRVGNREALRGIYAAVRDRNWNTIAPQISGLSVDRQDASFSISFQADCREGAIDFVWTGEIEGDASGTLVYRFDGAARSTCLRNRIGFCVLHPIRECAGRPCSVEKTDGRVEWGVFPQFISPHQPWMDLRAIRHEVLPGVQAEVRFDGDVFEMEDQRNWTDASFKTYCTPLGLPFPVEIPAGTSVRQQVTLRLIGERIGYRDERSDTPIEVRIGPEVRLPRLGLGAASHGQPLLPCEIDRLARLRLDHLRVDLWPSKPGFAETIRRAAAEARAIVAKLHAALFLTDAAEEELARVAAVAAECDAPVAAWMVFRAADRLTPSAWLAKARQILGPRFPDSQIGGGTDANFAELNRNRLEPSTADFVSYAINPQVHASDNDSIVETLEAQGETVRSARQLSGDASVFVSPLTLKPRFNSVATGEDRPPAPGELPREVDARQSSDFTAAWTLGSIARLAEAGAASATYFETTGWRGLMETEAGTPPQYAFPSTPGQVFPVYRVFAELADRDAVFSLVQSDDPLLVVGLAVQTTSGGKLLLANLTAEHQTVRTPDGLHTLPPHAIVRIETTEESKR